VFFDFFDVVKENRRALVENSLVLRNGRYDMDFKALEALARQPKNKVLFLCNPHNPISRVWSREELKRLGDICSMHGDITYPGHD